MKIIDKSLEDVVLKEGTMLIVDNTTVLQVIRTTTVYGNNTTGLVDLTSSRLLTNGFNDYPLLASNYEYNPSNKTITFYTEEGRGQSYTLNRVIDSSQVELLLP